MDLDESSFRIKKILDGHEGPMKIGFFIWNEKIMTISQRRSRR